MASAMAQRLEGKTIVITGASSGIGRSTAKEFAKTSPKNLRLIVTARRIDALKKLAEEIKTEVGEGVKVLPVKLDVSKPDGRPRQRRSPSPDIAPEDIDTMFATNVTGLINMTQEVLKIYKKRPDGGKGDIINIGSIAGHQGYPGRELIATRIRVIGVDPGQVETEFSVVRFYGDKAKADAVYANCEPLTPEDIAELIVFAAGRRRTWCLLSR
ncbi:hypothetical protein H2199_003557 [Coniosporium tulheliwenetii]|uniref:Uncharacterized protein n=1 Tax=Coniosporium tulheliwenetii TaxID=3383036 RepID=A0ACC2ZAJ9_9PEZI|nr:hypothetical protein H2199_003557 [Cladosporium sp. JES 115]